MIVLLINKTSVLPIQKEMLESSPINVFTTFYESFSIDTVVDFDEWLTDYIIPTNTEDMESPDVLKSIEKTLRDTKYLRKATFKLYPIQLELLGENYPKIKETILRIYKDKKTKSFEMLRFPELEKMYTKNVNKVQYV